MSKSIEVEDPGLEKDIYVTDKFFPDVVDTGTPFIHRLEVYLNGSLRGRLVEAKRGVDGYIKQIVTNNDGLPVLDEEGEIRIETIRGNVTFLIP